MPFVKNYSPPSRSFWRTTSTTISRVWRIHEASQRGKKLVQSSFGGFLIKTCPFIDEKWNFLRVIQANAHPRKTPINYALIRPAGALEVRTTGECRSASNNTLYVWLNRVAENRYIVSTRLSASDNVFPLNRRLTRTIFPRRENFSLSLSLCSLPEL